MEPGTGTAPGRFYIIIIIIIIIIMSALYKWHYPKTYQMWAPPFDQLVIFPKTINGFGWNVVYLAATLKFPHYIENYLQ
jgi:polyferredoxin